MTMTNKHAEIDLSKYVTVKKLRYWGAGTICLYGYQEG